jgi:hypothetical protein
MGRDSRVSVLPSESDPEKLLFPALGINWESEVSIIPSPEPGVVNAKAGSS